MKTKEVLKALEHCKSENYDCWNCPYSENSDCTPLGRDELVIRKLKKQQAKIKKLKAEVSMLRGQDILSCEACKFVDKGMYEKPCKKCSKRYINKFEPIEGKNK